jgi:hypothetical protein
MWCRDEAFGRQSLIFHPIFDVQMLHPPQDGDLKYLKWVLYYTDRPLLVGGDINEQVDRSIQESPRLKARECQQASLI